MPFPRTGLASAVTILKLEIVGQRARISTVLVAATGACAKSPPGLQARAQFEELAWENPDSELPGTLLAGLIAIESPMRAKGSRGQRSGSTDG